MTAHARREAPRECCGLLVGRGARVAFALPMANTHARPRAAFRLDPADHITIRRVLRRFAPPLEIVGVYHSHPAGGTRPSPRDLAEAHYPDWLFVIVGARGRAVSVFRLGGGRARRVSVRWTRR